MIPISDCGNDPPEGLGSSGKLVIIQDEFWVMPKVGLELLPLARSPSLRSGSRGGRRRPPLHKLQFWYACCYFGIDASWPAGPAARAGKECRRGASRHGSGDH